jgi:hypothetical protein
MSHRSERREQPMALNISCPHCARPLPVPDDYLGAGIRCPHCDAVFAAQQTGITATVPSDDGQLPYEIIDHVKVKERTLPRSARYQPGHGRLLLALGGASIGLSFLGMVACMAHASTPVLFGIPAFALGLAVWVLGQRDMEKIRIAVIDPYADRLTRLGWICGIIGTLLAVLVTLCGLGGLLLWLLAMSRNAT